MHAVNHAARTEKHQGFEESMCDDMKNPDDEGADTASEKHKAKLRDGRVSQHALNIVLRDANRRREDGSEGADDSDHQHHCLRMLKDDVRARQHVQTRRDHRGGVNQRGHRRGASHRIRQPNMKGKLRRFPARANHQTQSNPGHQSPVTKRLQRIAGSL